MRDNNQLIQTALFDALKENIVWMTNEPRSMFIHIKFRYGFVLRFNNDQMNKYFSKCKLSDVAGTLDCQELKGNLRDREIYNYLTSTSIIKISFQDESL